MTTGLIEKVLQITRNKKKKHNKIFVLAKSKLNSIETLISQALIDLEISREEFITIVKEKEKYEKMDICICKNKFVYIKMYQISKEAYKNCEIGIIDVDKYFWINRRDLEIESDYKNWALIFDKCDLEKQKYRHKLIHNPKFQPCRVFISTK